MGVRYFLLFLLCVPFCVCVVAIVKAQKGFTICETQECTCNTSKTALWKNISCNLHNTQVLKLIHTDIPKEITQMYITGGKEVKFSSKTFDTLLGLTLIHIDGTKKIIIENKSFFDIYSPILLVEINSCDELIIKTGAFENVQGSVSTEIINTKHVTIEQAAFSKLFNSTFKFVKNMILSEGSFDFKHQGNIGRHGPVTTILFDNVYIPKVPKEVFLASLASITFHNCKIGDLHTESFKATEISLVSMVNTSLEYIHEKAFTDRTLICDFKISKCNISKLHSGAVMAGIENLTLMHSSITDIQPRAVVTTVAKVEVIGNHIVNFHTSGFIFSKWNKITFEDNIIVHLHANFMETLLNSDIEMFSFRRNEMYIADQSALSHISELDNKILIFDGNFFNKSCECSIYDWLEEITNNSQKARMLMNTSLCPLNNFLSQCFSIPTGTINILNFTENICNNLTLCKTYNTNPKIFNETNRVILQNDIVKENWFILIFIVVGACLTILTSTLVIIIIKRSRWLKRKTYFRNIEYKTNLKRNEDRNSIGTEDDNEKLEIPEELTIEFLQILSKRLDDPKTYQEASEMIERLYETFIIEDNYANNNKQDEEPHLYEELGNLGLQIPPPPYEEGKYLNTSEPRNILKLMEEKFNTQCIDTEVNKLSPALVGEYSEPTDAEIHLYSELRHKNGKNNALGSQSLVTNSSKEILAPLQITLQDNSIFEPGPSFKV